MLDQITSYMMSFVTTNFESCGDSLESVFVDDSRTSKVGRKPCVPNAPQRPQSHSNFSGPEGACCHCGNVSRLTPFDDSLAANEDVTGILELQRFDGSDLLFFPVPTSEVVAFYGKNDPRFGGQTFPSSTRKSGIKQNNYPISIKTYENPLGAEVGSHEQLLKGSQHNSPRYRTDSPSPEVAQKWIDMGASRNSKENQKLKARSRWHPWDSTIKSHLRTGQQDVPYDEEKLPSSKSAQYRRYRKHQRPPTDPRRRLPLTLTTNSAYLGTKDTTMNSFSETEKKTSSIDQNKGSQTTSKGFISNPNDFRTDTTTPTSSGPPYLAQTFEEEEPYCNTPNKVSRSNPGIFQRLQLAPKPTIRPVTSSGISSDGYIARQDNGIFVPYPPSTRQQQQGEDRTPYFPDNFTTKYPRQAVKNFIMPKDESNDNSEEKKSHWKSAVDPRTGRTYYYHEITRETQWRKPMDLATDEEKRVMEEKEKKQKEFFTVMEANILNSISQGIVPGTPLMGSDASGVTPATGFGRRMSSRKVSLGPDGKPPELVRTISTMDEDILMDVIRRQPSFRNFKPGVSREDSLQPNDLLGYRRRSSEVRDGFESWSQGSQNQPLETLQERFNESTDSLPALFNYLCDENEDIDVESEMNASSLTGFGMTWEETQALKKLATITKEMIDVEKDVLVFEESPLLVKSTKTASTDSSPAWKPPKDDKEKRDLPRELDFDDSDEEEDDVDKPKHLPALNKARQGSDGRALPREIDFSSDEEEESAHTPTPKNDKPGKGLQKAEKKEKSQSRPEVKRRNTCGTMYIGTTMSAPDKDATIRCVCGVVRSHILSSEHDTRYTPDTDAYKIFNDQESERGSQNFDFSSKVNTKVSPPSLDEVSTFYRDIFFKAQMEADCIIMSLIYVERLIKKTTGRLRPRAGNWRSLLFSCMILSSKVWDDLSMWNVDFSQSCPPGVSFSLKRINELELAVLNALSFKVKVPASEYAKYYFLLRSMLIKSGLAGDDLSALNPLDVEGARKLQQVSTQFESLSLTQGDPLGPNQRSKSLNPRSIHKAALEYSTKPKLGLEQVVKM
ncbi:WW domain containing protein [Nitzschia inconspicua]|uniref:WW domain containing protein n=1 Tax=Nitzschia inconspicua TaxID=303405 RepID=A0A9K3PIZ0_9STRA|nr:WW domain containing protein [Nitzschia inconspicua]